MFSIPQLGLMARATLLRQTSAKVELAARHHSTKRFISALNALSNKENRFAAACCTRKVMIGEAAEWATRMADLRLKLYVATRTVAPDVLAQKRLDVACRELGDICMAVRNQGRVDNIKLLAELSGTPVPTLGTSGSVSPIPRAHLFPQPPFPLFAAYDRSALHRNPPDQDAAVPDGARRSSLPINVLFRYPARDPGVETRSVPPVLQVQAANALDESRVVWV